MKIYLLTFCLIAFESFAERSWQFESPARQTSLIELYTSEGCSSCPPAERRLNELDHHPGLWTDFVPIAFHVDYWNYIGWSDRFSSPAYTARQRHYSKQWKARTIYTPCFVENGKAGRSFHPKVGHGKPGVLKATITGKTIEIQFTPNSPAPKKLIAWAAPLSGRRVTQVKAGENRGRTLEHCFVALDLSSAEMKLEEGKGWTAELPLKTELKPQALAIWVSGFQSLEPIQATGGWFK